MKLNRNETGQNKYIVIKRAALDELSTKGQRETANALNVLTTYGVLLEGNANDPEEFFVIKLKDVYADRALWAYGKAAKEDDVEYGTEVQELAQRAGRNHPLAKQPD